jgi:predicted DNA-binding protein with PD1-like motif
MRSKPINTGELKTFALVFDDNDEVIRSLEEFAKKNEVSEQVELLSLIGDITLYKGKHQLHAHAVIGKRDGTACGGHLLKAIVHPTLELIINESPGYLQREMNEETGLPLIKI